MLFDFCYELCIYSDTKDILLPPFLQSCAIRVQDFSHGSFAPKNLYVQSSNHNMVWKHHEYLISKLKFDSYNFVENVVWDWKRGLHHKAILVQVVRLHNFGEMEEQEVVNLIYNWKKQTSTTKL